MRIAQVSPLYESVPPRYYGGTERIVSYLTEELVRQGHEVSLFASGDSATSAELVSCCCRSLRLDPTCIDPIPHQLLMLEKVFRMSERFDIVHFHSDYFHFPFTRRSRTTTVTTLHGRLDIPDLVPLYQEYPEMPVVSISDSQRSPLPWLNWQATIHHGLPADLLPLKHAPGSYLAFLGRVSPEKGLDTAIAIARRAGVKLKIAAKVDAVDREYHERELKPIIDGKIAEFVGEIGENEKGEFLGNALALLFPIRWDEPFGLVMIESMACGTPVIAFARGSVPEVVQNGISGFIVGSVDEAAAAVERVRSMSRPLCRKYFEERFAVKRMAEQYLSVYEYLVAEKKRRADLSMPDHRKPRTPLYLAPEPGGP